MALSRPAYGFVNGDVRFVQLVQQFWKLRENRSWQGQGLRFDGQNGTRLLARILQ